MDEKSEFGYATHGRCHFRKNIFYQYFSTEGEEGRGEATGIDLSQEDAVGFIAYVDDEEGVLEPDDVAAADAQVASEEGPEEDVDDLLGDEQLGGLVELVAASYE